MSARPPRLVVALTQPEMHDFFPEPLLGELCGFEPRSCTVDPAGEFASALAAAAPEVLLAGWATPRLPDNPPPSLRYVCYVAGTVKCLLSRRHIENGLL